MARTYKFLHGSSPIGRWRMLATTVNGVAGETVTAIDKRDVDPLVEAVRRFLACGTPRRPLAPLYEALAPFQKPDTEGGDARGADRLREDREDRAHVAGGGSVDSGLAPECPFCDYEGPSSVLHDFGDAFVIDPIDPVVPGHVLVIPKAHVVSFAPSPPTTAMVMERAAEYALAEMHGDCNLITSKGAAATQTVKHLHVHLVPRRPGDELALPWSTQQSDLQELLEAVEAHRPLPGSGSAPTAQDYALYSVAERIKKGEG